MISLFLPCSHLQLSQHQDGPDTAGAEKKLMHPSETIKYPSSCSRKYSCLPHITYDIVAAFWINAGISKKSPTIHYGPHVSFPIADPCTIYLPNYLYLVDLYGKCIGKCTHRGCRIFGNENVHHCLSHNGRMKSNPVPGVSARGNKERGRPRLPCSRLPCVLFCWLFRKATNNTQPV